ncbi:Hypothetical protein CAP_7110 [Chondromyces apiculatus DSM 436]|uniref:Uncharacterized protein n=1 Tax=Chondromyces apiculatus DSM 436 TaxID=1192034 RepID=A0A017SZU3_9BACT|nr:Hypothetical protein CAP_7110 [Chondromyces apiculatus DSM 436]
MASAHAREAVETVYAARLAPPLDPSPVARLAYGAGLPLAVASALLAHPEAGRRYRRVCFTQAALVLGISVALGVSWGHVTKLLGLLGETRIQISSSGDVIRQSAKVTLDQGLAFWSSLYATLCAVEWAVIALSRQYHDAIARDAALLTGAMPEDPPLTPHVSVDIPWMWTRGKRYLRGWMVFLAGVPALSLLLVVPGVGRTLYAIASAVWGVYWLAVLVAAKSAYAWREEGTAPAPWFVRGWDWLTSSVLLFQWGLPRLYGQMLRKWTQQVFSPAARFERSPWELSGVAIARVLGGIPGFYLLVRPLIPVAAQHVLRAQDERS